MDPTLSVDTARDGILDALTEQRILAIVRAADRFLARQHAEEILTAGISVIEVSLSTPGALDLVADLVVQHPDAIVGVGTVLSAASVLDAAAVGARFFVAPALDDESVHAAHRHGLGSFPGCATPTEMLRATRLGATGVKVFPARAWTPEALADVLQAMPDLNCVPTGGLALADVSPWVHAGAVALGLGSALTGHGAQIADFLARGARSGNPVPQ
jgi:2-dehydro-3-deoxyphosphogluconate aldolase/(4S)-4-hydroxy-2-oxoglutarate aldolase